MDLLWPAGKLCLFCWMMVIGDALCLPGVEESIMDKLHQAHGRCLDLIEGSIAACSRQTHSPNKMYTCFWHVSPYLKARLPKLSHW